MPYLGVAPNPRENREVDDISSSFNGSNTAFTLQSGGSNVSPGSDTAIIVSLGGVIQNPGTDYTIAASTITFTTAPASGLSFFGVVLAQSIDIETTADGTVTTAKIVDGAVTNAKVNASAAIAVSKLANFVTNNADNRVITGSGTTNTLNGEADLTFDGNDLTINKTGGDSDVIIKTTTSGNPVLKFNAAGAGGHEIAFDRSDTALTFTTTGSAERMRINSSGNLLIGTTSDSIFNDTSGGGLNIKSGGQIVIAKQATSSADPLVWLNDTGQTTNKSIVFAQDGSEKANIGLAGNDATITVNGSERLRIDSLGRIGINNISPAERLEVSYGHADVGIVVSTTDTFASGNSVLMQFREVNTVGGSIAFTNGGTSTAYVTSSDYRLKENVVTLTDAITRLKTLKPYRFNFIKTPDITVDGFLAHEVTAVPEAVTGEKDAMQKIKYTEEDELPEGKNVGDFKEYSTTEIDPQGVDYAKFTPLLTAALQEAIVKIETLEAKVAALEAA